MIKNGDLIIDTQAKWSDNGERIESFAIKFDDESKKFGAGLAFTFEPEEEGNGNGEET